MPPTSFGSPGSHASVQFLNSVLSQRGPAALLYEEGLKITIRSHLVNLLEEFPSLQVKTESFTHNDGKTSNLLQVDGTIPMYYLEVMYNIPVTLWLLEDYPKKPPRAFVTPTRDMIIKRPHRHVDASGLVSVPYIQSWVFPRSNLVELVRSLSLVFGQDPPLYLKPPIPGHSPPPPSVATTMAAGVTSGFRPGVGPLHINPPLGAGGVVSGGAYPPSSSSSAMSSSSVSPVPVPHPPAVSQNHVPPPSSLASTASMSPYPGHHPLPQHPPYPPYRHSQPARASEPPSVVAELFRRNTITTLVERIHRDIAENRKTKELAMDKLFTTQSMLWQHEEICKKGIQELQREKEALEQQLQTILTNTDFLETWLNSNQKSNTDVDIDGAFEPCDSLSKQLLECSASDLATEDVLYSLDKAVQEGSIPVDAYLKHVRTLSREQFFHRATAMKVRAAQAQSQIAVMGSRATYFSS